MEAVPGNGDVLLLRMDDRHHRIAIEPASGPDGFCYDSMLRDDARPPSLLMHPDDCRRLGFTTGQAVRINSATGSTTGALEVTESIRPGVVSLPHGWSTPGVNHLTSVTDAVDALTGMPRLGGFPVTVTAAPEPRT